MKKGSLIRGVSFLLTLLCCCGCLSACFQKETEEPVDSAPPVSEDTVNSDAVSDKKDPDTDKENEKDMNPITYSINSRTWGVKVLGVRSLESETQINCDWTCSGIEMNIEHFGGDITFSVGSDKGCYFKALIDGKVFKSFQTPTGNYFEVDSAEEQIVLKDVPEGKHTLRLLKVTGHTLARAQIYSVTFAGKILDPVYDEEPLYIEYVGDSICCGWGTIGNNEGAYTDQDGTFAYPYRVSEALGADYSITALSGQGLLVGAPGVLNGYLYSSPLRDAEEKYSFSRKADVVVINIGTNDWWSYSTNQEPFANAYMQFLNTVKEKNGPDCKIVCIYNTMNNTFPELLNMLCGNKEDQGIYLLKFDRAYSGHPTILENRGYTEVLLDFLKDNVLK